MSMISLICIIINTTIIITIIAVGDQSDRTSDVANELVESLQKMVSGTSTVRGGPRDAYDHGC